MKIGLFDLYTNGHHLPYAARIKQAVEASSGHDIKFITLSETPRCRKLFDQEDIVYLDNPDSPRIEDRDGKFDDIADSAVSDLFTNYNDEGYDVFHFLFADDILGPLYRYAPTSDGPQLVGELNGVFFERKTKFRQQYSHPIVYSLLKLPARKVIDFIVPEHTDHEQLWRDLYLYRCLDKAIFDYLVLHSREADEYVSQLNTNETTLTRNIPYPAPVDFGAEISQQEARARLDLPDGDSILLFFGTLREEKGIDRLLRVLRQYRGPEFTMHIAGPPIDVSEERVRSVRSDSPLKIITELDYIENPEVYFRAADSIVLPYTREFGKECTSQTLEEACSSLLPVIVPDFGAVGRVTTEWALGMTYEPDSDEALETALAEFARNGVPYSREQMRRYNQIHSYEQAATELVTIYSGKNQHTRNRRQAP